MGKEFTGKNVKVLTWYEGMQKRYGMYAGVDPVNHCVKEILDNSIDEYMSGFGDEIDVILDTNKNAVTIRDEGRGIPLDIHPTEKKPTMEVLFSNVHAGSKFDDDSGENVGGLNGVGVKIANALSKLLRVQSERDGKRMYMEFSGGKVVKTLTKIKTKGKRGTTVTFIPDDKYFEDKSLAIFNKEALKETCKMRAYLNKGIRINLIIDKEKFSFKYDNGINDLIDDIVPNKLFNMPILGFDRTIELEDGKGKNRYEISMVYDTKTTNENFLAYTNGIVNIRGTHLTGFKTALTSIFNKYIQENNLLPKKNKGIQITGDDIRKGIFVIINIKIRNPKYEGQTKEGIGNKEVQSHITSLMNEYFSEWIANNESIMKKICNRIIQFAIATDNVKKAQDKIVKSTGNTNLSFSQKYIPCNSNDPSKCELYIIEGQSARGPLRQVRNTEYQALYSLRGKMPNTFNANIHKLLGNKETEELMRVLFGTNDIKLINEKKSKLLRFHKVIATADADDDGFHINSLIGLYIETHFPWLIEEGYFYNACPPLYKIVISPNNYKYLKNNKELYEFKSECINKRYKLLNSDLTIQDIVSNENKYKNNISKIANEKSIPINLISRLLSSTLKDTLKYLKQNKLSITKRNNNYYAQGLLDYDWIDLEFDKEFLTEVSKLKNIYGQTTIEYEDKENKKKYNQDIYEVIVTFDKTFSYNPIRLKGLGESEAKDLEKTVLNPNTRDLIKVSIEDIELADADSKCFFGNNPELRKEFIKENL